MIRVRSIPMSLALCLAACGGAHVDNKQQALAAIARGDMAAAQIHLQNALDSAPGDPELHFLNGKVAIANANAELAKTELAPLLDHAKYGAEARTLLAEAYLSAGNARLALETLGDSLASGRSYAIAVNAQALVGHAQEAAGLLAKGLAAYPQSVELLATDADAAITAGDLKRAQADLARATTVAPKDKQVLLLAGRIALIEGNPARAERAFDAVLGQDQANSTALLAKAALAHDRGDSAATNDFLARADKAAHGSLPQTRAYMAQMALEAGDLNRANQLIESLPNGANLPFITMLRGIIAAARGQNEQAVSLLQAYLSHGGDGAAARAALSQAYLAIGDKAKAWTTIRPLANAANAGAQTLALAARIAADLKQPEAAAYQARAQALSRPDPIAGEMTAANRAIATGDWAKADAIYQRLLAQPANGDNIIILNNAALARLNLGDKPQAVALARRAAARAPDDPVVTDTLAWSLFQQGGASPEVIALARKAITAQPGDTEIRGHVAMIANALRPPR